MSRSWAWCAIVQFAMCLASSSAFAQDSSLRAALPPIAYDEWRRVPDTEDMREFTLSFPSAVTTLDRANNRVPLSVFLPLNGPASCPVVVVLHYWGARDLRTERGLARDLADLGVASVIMALPYHLQRTPPGTVSGARAIEPDPDKLVGTMTQSALDVRRTLDWIGTRPEFDRKRVGIVRISLGALVAALSYGLDDRFGKGAFMLGGADLAHILWNSSVVVPQRDALRGKGFTEDKLRTALEPVEPLRYLPDRKAGTAFVIGAKHDTVIPPEDVRKLIEALPDAKTLWLDTGHYGGIFVQRRLTRLVARYFATEFSGGNYQPPRAIYAPTIRFGAVANTNQGFQIAVSLDVWRWGRNDATFGAIMAAPNGAQFFLGQNLNGGLNVGTFVGPKTISLGMYWSVVL